MSAVKDMTGQRFGKLLVLNRDITHTGGAAYWICQCDCGKKISVRGQALREGKTDCGCGTNKRLSKAAHIDTTSLIGKRFGRLVVIERDMTKPRGHGCSSYWICQCDCGNKKSISYNSLVSKKTQSCGCLVKEVTTKRNTKNITNMRFGMVVAKENTFQLSDHNSYIWRCECDCGNKEYYVSVENLMSGRIHSCGCNKRSYGEKKINEFLLNNEYNFIQEYCFKNSEISNLRYDFAILNDNNQIIRLIEFDGEQHLNFKNNDKFGGEETFKIRKLHDEQKNKYAKEHNIPLVRIPYTELNNLSLELIMGNKYLL